MVDCIDKNLNCLLIDDADSSKGVNLEDYSCSSSDVNISVFFRNIEYELINKIESADAVFGCIAWLTNYKILESLSKIHHVSIVVQKEDFLKPDVCSNNNYRTTLMKKYKSIQSNVSRFSLEYPANALSYAGSFGVDSIRCVGNYNSEKRPSFPRMHNKFLVFCKYVEAKEDECNYKPYAVWTGSFNFSTCATKSFENTVFIENSEIPNAYFKEYCQILALSEPLNWETDWVCPEWRIGS